MKKSWILVNENIELNANTELLTRNLGLKRTESTFQGFQAVDWDLVVSYTAEARMHRKWNTEIFWRGNLKRQIYWGIYNYNFLFAAGKKPTPIFTLKGSTGQKSLAFWRNSR